MYSNFKLLHNENRQLVINNSSINLSYRRKVKLDCCGDVVELGLQHDVGDVVAESGVHRYVDALAQVHVHWQHHRGHQRV